MTPRSDKPPPPLDVRLVDGPLTGRRYRLAHDTPDLIVVGLGRYRYERRGRTDRWFYAGPKMIHADDPVYGTDGPPTVPAAPTTDDGAPLDYCPDDDGSTDTLF